MSDTHKTDDSVVGRLRSIRAALADIRCDVDVLTTQTADLALRVDCLELRDGEPLSESPALLFACAGCGVPTHVSPASAHALEAAGAPILCPPCVDDERIAATRTSAPGSPR